MARRHTHLVRQAVVRRAFHLLVAALVPFLSACGEENADTEVLVLAASSLNNAMPELIERFEETVDVDVEVVYGATGNLAAQIENGAPADLFFSADEPTVQRLGSRGLVRPGSVMTYAVGQLVLVWREGLVAPQSLLDLQAPRFEAVAIANPEVAPYGAAAVEAFRRVAILDAIQPRLVFGENVSQTYQLVRTGNADAALVAQSVLVDAEPEGYLPIDPQLHEPVRQVAALLTGSTNPAAALFLEFVLSETGQTILAENGFAPPVSLPQEAAPPLH